MIEYLCEINYILVSEPVMVGADATVYVWFLWQIYVHTRMYVQKHHSNNFTVLLHPLQPKMSEIYD